MKKKEVTFLLPCLNEELTIKKSINMIKKFVNRTNIDAEILVIDNGSVDNSVNIAKKLGARIEIEKHKGYGNALRRGFFEANGKYIIMGDCDTTYDFENVDEFIDKLRDGYELVMGNRYRGGIEKGAMPFLHKYIGVPLLSYYGRKKYKIEVYDFHCGLRGINTDVVNRLNLKSEGMELATEMIYLFAKNKKKIIEIPTILKKCSSQERKPHLKTIKDGIRHIKFIFNNKL